MFGRTTPDAIRLPYRDIAKPGVRFLQQTITAIDPEARRVTTDGGVHDADFLVVALGRITISMPRRDSPKEATSSTP
jgi:sulfide:quinone oxidoreductase